MRRHLVALLFLLLLPLTAEAGSLWWPGYDKWSWTDYGCWLPTDPTGQWHVVITYPSASGAAAWDWNVVQMRANNGAWVATFLFHYKECLWAYSPDLPGYLQLRPSLPGMPGEGWLHGLVLSHPSLDGVWYVASTPDGSQSFRWAPASGKVREIMAVGTPGVVTDPQPWPPRPPGHLTYEWHGPELQYVHTTAGEIYLDLPYDGQRFLVQDVPSDVIPFNPSLGTARQQADFAMAGMSTAMEKVFLKVSEMDAFISVTLAANPNWPPECGGNAACQRDLRQEKLRTYIAAAEIELEKLELHYSMLKGVMAYDGAFTRYFPNAEQAAFLSRQAILDMGMMYRFVFPRPQRAEPNVRQNQVVLASLPEPVAPIPPTPPAPQPAPPVAGPALTPQQEETLRVVANYYAYGRAHGFSEAYIQSLMGPIMGGPVLGGIARDPAYVGTISTVLRGYHPDIVSDYTGMIDILNSIIGNFPSGNRLIRELNF